MVGGTAHWSVGNIFIRDPTIGLGLEIHSPTTPNSYPVLIFLANLNGIALAITHTQMLTTVAEQNIIVIAISKRENIKPERIALHVDHFLDWVIKLDNGAACRFPEHRAVKW